MKKKTSSMTMRICRMMRTTPEHVENKPLITRRHLFCPRLHRTVWTMLRVAAIFLALALAVPLPSQPSPAGITPSQEKEEKEKKKPQPFVLTGTVFRGQGFALAGAEIRVRRAGEKKVRGKARSDRRGEFGIRLPANLEYEVTVEAKGYETETRKFTAQLGAANNFVFRMKPESGEKP